ncbi:hypothetical protein J27TS8_17400 [Robertmurraya siralis]|uniref:Uncharacterized protein n=1 Tax=Robertmurraya siralis TaxID=77777 RepID=A0A920BTY7_9BACI|nr:hypothetical protein CHH80_06685 [Bacillus sp. 7504-2]GIN61747.1 hypothetical protein J27TS8_17400 [Robertmurraya siralis]
MGYSFFQLIRGVFLRAYHCTNNKASIFSKTETDSINSMPDFSSQENQKKAIANPFHNDEKDGETPF